MIQVNTFAFSTTQSSGISVGITNTWTAAQAFTASPSFTKVNNISTQGAGVPVICQVASSNTLGTQDTNLIYYTPPAASGAYRISGYVNMRILVYSSNLHCKGNIHRPNWKCANTNITISIRIYRRCSTGSNNCRHILFSLTLFYHK